MKHNVKELYKVNGEKFYTEDYLAIYNIPKAKSWDIRNGWTVAHALGSNKDSFRIYTAEGVKIAYAYGEKTWFDTQEERDAYREEQNILRTITSHRNKVLKEITNKLNLMTTEELENFLKNM